MQVKDGGKSSSDLAGLWILIISLLCVLMFQEAAMVLVGRHQSILPLVDIASVLLNPKLCPCTVLVSLNRKAVCNDISTGDSRGYGSGSVSPAGPFGHRESACVCGLLTGRHAEHNVCCLVSKESWTVHGLK